MTLEDMEERLSATESTLEEIKKRLRVVEDIEEIKQLQYRYLNCVMFAKWDEIMDCFAEDAFVYV